MIHELYITLITRKTAAHITIWNSIEMQFGLDISTDKNWLHSDAWAFDKEVEQ